MSRPNDNQLVFTLPEALSEIRDLRAQRDTLRSALNAMLACGEVRAWDHHTSSPKQREAMKMARAAVDQSKS